MLLVIAPAGPASQSCWTTCWRTWSPRDKINEKHVALSGGSRGRLAHCDCLHVDLCIRCSLGQVGQINFALALGRAGGTRDYSHATCGAATHGEAKCVLIRVV